jgi:adenylate cyclase
VTILRYSFEGYSLDTERRELRRGDALVTVEPKVFDLLALLIANRERVVSRDDLIAHVWGGRIVSEAALARCINGARTAIGDSGDAQRLIKTLQRKGVRFVGEAREERLPAGMSATAAGAERPAPALALPDRPSIAVLPLDNISGDKEQEYFSNGISEDITTELSRFSELFVIARNSSFQYKNRVVDVRQVGRELGVRYVLQGSIRRDGDRVRISAQLADTVTGTQRWAERYDRQLTDVFAVQDEVARTIAALLAAHVNKAEIERTLSKPPAAWQAYDYYLRAVEAHASFIPAFKVADLYEVRRLLEQSLAIDPNYARAYARLAWTYFSAWVEPLDADYLNPATLDRAHQLARRAFQLDPNLPEAHARLGMMLVRRREYSAGIAAFEQALTLNPNFTDFGIAHALVLAGEPARAVEAANRQKRLDPFYWPLVPAALGMAHYVLQQYSEALPPLRECAARAPNMRIGHLWLAATCAQLGRIEEARAAAAEVLRIEPQWTNLRTGATIYVFRRLEDAQHLLEGLRKAGLPE